MGRPKKWKDGKQKSIVAESKVWEFFETNTSLDPGSALEEWIRAQVPRNQSAAEYRIVQIEKDLTILKADYDNALRELTTAYDEARAKLSVEKNLLLQRKSDDVTLLKSLWPQWRKEFPRILKPNKMWCENFEVNEWWNERGIPLTWADILNIWDDMEG
jgi:hypothetical protein